MDLIHLLYSHQVALIRAAERRLADGHADFGNVDNLADQIRSKRSCLGVTQYEMAVMA